MNIESANLSSLAPINGTAESMPPPLTGTPLTENSVIPDGFSGALVAQIELLNNLKTGDLLPQQASDSTGLPSINGTDGVAGLPPGMVDMQDFAALLGNDLPPTYKTKDDVDHEAALAAVTDTLKYIAMGTTAGEKAVEVEQNIKDVIAMTVPAEQNMKDDAVPVAVSVEQSIKDVNAKLVSPGQSIKDVATDIKQGMKDAIFTDASNPMDLKQANDKQQINEKQDKKQVEGEAQIADVEVADATTDNRGTEGLAADIILPAIMPVEQGKTVANNLTSADAINEDVLSSFIKLPTGNAKPNQPTKALDDALQSKAIFRQPIQDKQGFNFKYFENAAQTEKTGPVEKQAVSLEAEKSLPRVGDMTQLNKPIVDNKVDVPAITKPLSHPEWNKDLGDRIVWMSSRAIPAAEIKLNPQHLGPISVRVNVADDQATVVFTAQHAATREALEASIPKLREMMTAQQLNLVEVNVSHSATSDQGRSQSQNFAQTADSRGQGSVVAVDGVDDVEQEIEAGRAIVSKGLLSIYA